MQADWFTVFAKTGEPSSRLHTDICGFIVEATARVLRGEGGQERWASRAIDTTEIVFDHVAVGPIR